jgi:hypothetical protein
MPAPRPDGIYQFVTKKDCVIGERERRERLLWARIHRWDPCRYSGMCSLISVEAILD